MNIKMAIAVMERGKTMSEYIRKEDAMELVDICTDTDADKRFFIEQVKAIPSVRVVRCKDCMWGNNKTRSGKRYCELSDMYQVDDGFCNWGEKIK